MSQTAVPTAREGGTPLPLEQAVAWGLAGSIGYALCQWAVLVVIARLGTPELVGRFAYGLAIAAPVIMLTNMQLGWFQATDGARAFDFDTYWRHRVTFSLLGMAVITVIALTKGDWPVARIVLLVGAAKVFESWSDVHHGRFQRIHRVDLVARSQLIRGFAAVAVVAGWIGLTGQLWPAVCGLAVVWFSIWLFHDRLVGWDQAETRRPTWDRVALLARQAYPLGLTAMLVSVNVSVPRLIIERLSGAHALGVFSAIAYLVVGGRMVALPFGQVYAPRLGEALAAGDRLRFSRLLRNLVLVASALGGVGLVVSASLGSEVLRVLYGDEYAREQPAFVVMMLAAAVGYLSTFIQIGVTAARAIGAQVAVVLLSILATSIAAWLLVPGNPIAGGAWAMAVGAGVELVGSLFLLRRIEWRVPPPPPLDGSAASRAAPAFSHVPEEQP